mmetsp:Transcript_6690/g.10578  ORF Transcript_6690/g.10578 Transcript_6690/m.10578 type:complete len:279 (+) Transcript_6690:660-1496(+)
MDTRVRHQVGLELGDVHVEGSIETEGGSQGGDALSHQTVQVGVGGALDIQVPPADIVDGLVIDGGVHVHVLQESVARQDGVVRLDHSGGDLGGGDDGEAKLGLLAVVDREALAKESGKAGAGAATDGVEDHEALETGTVVGQLPDAVEHEVDNLLAHGVVATGEVVGGILLAGDELLRVEELAVGSGTDLVDHGGLEVDEDTAGHVLASTSLREEGVEGIVSSADGLVGGHLAVRLDAVLEAEKLPAGISGLATSLADLDGKNLTHCGLKVEERRGVS